MRDPVRTVSSILALVLMAIMTATGTRADTLHVAVASNFQRTLKALIPLFEARTGHRIVVSWGATGRLYAQIINGAPHQAFLAADTIRPARLERDGRAMPGTRFTYAEGRLMLCGSAPALRTMGLKTLAAGKFTRLAMANPRLAPYGRAAREVLEHLGLMEALRLRIVRGENIGQTFHFVRSGAAELGLVAMSQVLTLPERERPACILVPENLHAPILQQAVLLKDTPAARAFLAFLRSPEARKIIRSHGYGLPK